MTRGCQCRRPAFSSNEKRGRFGEQAGERIAAFAGGRHGGAARHPATRKKGGSPRDAMVAGADQEEPLPPQWPAHRAQIARRPAAGGLANAARIACGRGVASVAAASACRSASGPAEILRRGKRAARVRACRPAARGEPARAALAALASSGERRLAARRAAPVRRAVPRDAVPARAAVDAGDVSRRRRSRDPADIVAALSAAGRIETRSARDGNCGHGGDVRHAVLIVPATLATPLDAASGGMTSVAVSAATASSAASGTPGASGATHRRT